MQVVTFENYRPPRRYDAIPWTQVQVHESADPELGGWSLIDTIALSPLDSNPASPQARDFTTEKGTAVDYWYRVVFADATGDTSIPTQAVQNTVSTTAPAVLAYATVEELFRLLAIRTPTAAQTEAGQRVLDAAALEIDEELGRSEPFDDPPAIVVEVNLERAVEHWQQQQAPFGILGLGGIEGGATRMATDTWKRHAEKLSFLKTSWGLA